MIYIIFIFILINPFSEPLCPVDGGGVILDETTPIRIEMFPQNIKLIRQKNITLNIPFKGTVGN